MPAFLKLADQFINADRILRVEVITSLIKQGGYRVHFTNGTPSDYTDEESIKAMRSYLMNNLVNKRPLTADDFPNG